MGSSTQYPLQSLFFVKQLCFSLSLCWSLNVQVITNLFISLNVSFITAITESRQALFKGLISSLTQVAKILLSFPWRLTLCGPDIKLFFEYVFLTVLLCYTRGSGNPSGTWNKQNFYCWLKLSRFFPILAIKGFFSFRSGEKKQHGTNRPEVADAISCTEGFLILRK